MTALWSEWEWDDPKPAEPPRFIDRPVHPLLKTAVWLFIVFWWVPVLAVLNALGVL